MPFPQHLKLLQHLIYLWFKSLFSCTSAKGTVGKNFCSIVNFQGRSDLRSECDFSCLVHILSANSEFFRFDTFVYVHEIYALNSDDSIPDIFGVFLFF